MKGLQSFDKRTNNELSFVLGEHMYLQDVLERVSLLILQDHIQVVLILKREEKVKSTLRHLFLDHFQLFEHILDLSIDVQSS